MARKITKRFVRGSLIIYTAINKLPKVKAGSLGPNSLVQVSHEFYTVPR